MSARTPSDPRQWSEAERWLARADEDLRAAEALLTLAPPAVDPAAFHCQQAAEKMAKAVLIAVREAPPRMHDIEELGRRVRAYVPDIGRALEALGGVTAWYTAARYPDAGLSTGLTADDLADTLSRLHELRRHVADLKPKPPVD